MKLPSFDYAAPATLSDAAALLAEHSGDVKIIAGGQSLLPIMAFRLASPALLVDIGKIPNLRHVREDETGLHLGPLVRWCDIERSDVIARCHPLLREAVTHVAHYQVRNRGTIGGSLAHADPAAEFPCVVVTCNAVITVFSKAGQRKVTADRFILGELETDLRPDEIIVDIHFPAWPKHRLWGFSEFSKRRGDFALGGVAAYIDIDQQGVVSDCAIGMMGASDRAMRLPTIEAMMKGSRPDTKIIRAASQAAREVVNPPEDIHASRSYRKALISTLVERTLTAALNRSKSESMS